MTKTLIPLFLLLFLGNMALAQDSKCARKAAFGDTKICLPIIKGYKECYTDPAVKPLADATEAPANMVLGFYLTNKVFGQKEKLGEIRFDDYFKVYGTKEIMNVEADGDALQQMQEVLSSNFISKNWESMLKELDKTGLDVEIGAPTIVKSYSPNERSFTYIMLTKYELEGGSTQTLAMTMNGVLLSDRLIWVAYYLNYEGKETISTIETNSNKILNSLLEADK